MKLLNFFLSNKTILIVLILLVLLSAIILYIYSSNKARINFIVFVSRLPDGFVKDRISQFINNNIPGMFLYPTLVIDKSSYYYHTSPETKYVSDLLDKKAKSPSKLEFINSLIKYTSDNDSGVRCSAVYYLGQTGEVRVLEPILRLAKKEKDPNVLFRCVYVLGNLRDIRAVNFIGNIALKHPKVIVKREAAIALRLIKSNKCKKFLLKSIYDNDEVVRENSLYGLAFYSDRNDIKRIKPFLKDKNQNVRQAAQHAIECIEESHPLPSQTKKHSLKTK